MGKSRDTILLPYSFPESHYHSIAQLLLDLFLNSDQFLKLPTVSQSRFLFLFSDPVTVFSSQLQFLDRSYCSPNPFSVPFPRAPSPILCPDSVHRSCSRTRRQSQCSFPVPIPFSFPISDHRCPLWTTTWLFDVFVNNCP